MILSAKAPPRQFASRNKKEHPPAYFVSQKGVSLLLPTLSCQPQRPRMQNEKGGFASFEPVLGFIYKRNQKGKKTHNEGRSRTKKDLNNMKQAWLEFGSTHVEPGLTEYPAMRSQNPLCYNRGQSERFLYHWTSSHVHNHYTNRPKFYRFCPKPRYIPY